MPGTINFILIVFLDRIYYTALNQQKRKQAKEEWNMFLNNSNKKVKSVRCLVVGGGGATKIIAVAMVRW